MPAKRRLRGGRWQVMRERCCLDNTFAPPSDAQCETVESIVSRVVRKIGLEEHAWFAELSKAWPGLVGPEIARHARPGRVDGSVLTVFVDSSVWLSELHRSARGPMLDKLSARFGKRITALRFALDPDTPPPPGIRA